MRKEISTSPSLTKPRSVSSQLLGSGPGGPDLYSISASSRRSASYSRHGGRGQAFGKPRQEERRIADRRPSRECHRRRILHHRFQQDTADRHTAFRAREARATARKSPACRCLKGTAERSQDPAAGQPGVGSFPLARSRRPCGEFPGLPGAQLRVHGGRSGCRVRLTRAWHSIASRRCLRT